LDKKIYTNKINIIEKILNNLTYEEEFENAKLKLIKLSDNLSTESKRKLYEKLKNTIEAKINEFLTNSVIFPDVINNYLKKKLKVKYQIFIYSG
jgi:hypothetical protein